jgi:transposase-like protein
MNTTEHVSESPKTLTEAICYFSNEDTCLQFVVSLRWPDGVLCPRCGSREVSFLKTRRIWKCSVDHDHRQFSIKVGTIFEDSPISLTKWLPAIWLLVSCKNGVSSYEIHRALGVTQKTAWFMLHRIRLAMQTGTFEKMSGQVEADGTYIGGAAQFMHKEKKEQKITGAGGSGKTIVMGLLERHTIDRSKRSSTPLTRTKRRARSRVA